MYVRVRQPQGGGTKGDIHMNQKNLIYVSGIKEICGNLKTKTREIVWCSVPMIYTIADALGDMGADAEHILMGNNLSIWDEKSENETLDEFLLRKFTIDGDVNELSAYFEFEMAE